VTWQVALPQLGVAVPLFVEELVIAGRRILDEVALLPLAAHDHLHIGQRVGLAVDVALGRAGVALAVLGPGVDRILEQALRGRLHHFAVIGRLPGLELGLVAGAALVGADELIRRRVPRVGGAAGKAKSRSRQQDRGPPMN
jgi:hypothetical protein